MEVESFKTKSINKQGVVDSQGSRSHENKSWRKFSYF